MWFKIPALLEAYQQLRAEGFSESEIIDIARNEEMFCHLLGGDLIFSERLYGGRRIEEYALVNPDAITKIRFKAGNKIDGRRPAFALNR